MYADICIYTHTHKYIHIQMYTSMYIRICSRRNQKKSTYICIHIYISTDTCRSIQYALGIGIVVSRHIYVD